MLLAEVKANKRIVQTVDQDTNGGDPILDRMVAA